MLAFIASIATCIGVFVGQHALWSAPGMVLAVTVVARSIVALVSRNTRHRWAWMAPLLISLLLIVLCGGVVYVLGPLKDASAP
jgi:hypothetical protein